jgi:hypothetical protein
LILLSFFVQSSERKIMCKWLKMILGKLRSSARSHRELALENLALRQQLATLKYLSGVVRKNSIGVAKQPIGTHDASRSGQVLR